MQAYLPAGKVAKACQGVLRDIEKSRREAMNKIIEARRPTGFLWIKRTHEEARKLLTKEELEIPKLHRSEEENRVIDILHLAQAVITDDSSFTIMVTPSDFAILHKFYPDKEMIHA